MGPMGERSVPESAEPVRTLPLWARPLVAFHVLAITVWCLPPPAPAIANGSLAPTLDTESVAAFARSVVPFVHDNILLFASRVKNPPPETAGPMNGLALAVRGYLIPTGMWQYWDMFAPNPSNLDVWVDATVEYQDGTRVVHTYPRVANVSIPLKYVMERYRKFLERAHSEDFEFLWPAFAQRIAFEEFRDPKNPPVHVTLRRHFRTINPPDEPSPEEYTVYAYYEHSVNLTLLQGAAGTP